VAPRPLGDDRPPVHLVASTGGHLELMSRLSDCFANSPRRWVISAESGAAGLRRDGETVLEISIFSRADPLSAVRNVLSSLALAVEHRPRYIVVTGAGRVVAFCLFSRLLGARLLFVETMARITSPSASGWILSRLASQTLVQWPEMSAVYPRTTVCRPALLEGLESLSVAPGEGCLVAVGTHHQPFDRLLSMVDRGLELECCPCRSEFRAVRRATDRGIPQFRAT